MKADTEVETVTEPVQLRRFSDLQTYLFTYNNYGATTTEVPASEVRQNCVDDPMVHYAAISVMVDGDMYYAYPAINSPTFFNFRHPDKTCWQVRRFQCSGGHDWELDEVAWLAHGHEACRICGEW